MTIHSPIGLRSGRSVARVATGRRNRYTLMSPVRLQQRMDESAHRSQRKEGANRRYFQVGSTRMSVLKSKHDAVTETTIAIAHKQQQKHENATSGISGAISINKLRIVLKKQGQKNKRFTSWKTLKRLLKQSLQYMVSGRTGLHLQNSILLVHRNQFEWTSYETGNVPLRPLGFKTLEHYTKDMWSTLLAADPSRSNWAAIGSQWIDNLVLPSCYYEFPDEYYEFAVV